MGREREENSTGVGYQSMLYHTKYHTFCPILRTVVNTVDIISWGWDLFKSLWSVVAGEGLVAPFTIDVEREVLDHIRLEWNVSQGRDDIMRDFNQLRVMGSVMTR